MAIDKRSRTAAAAGSVLVVLAIAALVNALADRAFRRLDLTAEQRYSISEDALRLIGGLEAELKITYFVSPASKWPVAMKQQRKDLLDKLREFEIFGKGKVKLEVVDVADDEELEKKLVKEGFRQQAVQELKHDEYSLKHFLSGFRISYQDREAQIVPFLYLPEDLEYELMLRLVKLKLKQLPTVALNHPKASETQLEMARKRGEAAPATGFDWIQHKNALGSLFALQLTDIKLESPIPPEAKVLLVVNPRSLSERQRYEVERYLCGGGSVILFASPLAIENRGRWIAEARPSGLEDWLSDLGVTLANRFLCDQSCVSRTEQGEYGQPLVQKNPYYLMVDPKNLSKESVLTRHIPGFVMPYPAVLELDRKRLAGHQLECTVLAKSSDRIWQEEFQQIPAINKDKLENLTLLMEPVPLMVWLSGTFPFSYRDQPVPAWPKEAEPEGGEGHPPAPEKAPAPVEKAQAPPPKRGNLVVCSAPEMLNSAHFRSQDEYYYFMNSPLPFLLGATEKFALGEELGNIRTKKYEDRRIDRLAGKEYNQTRLFLKGVMILGTPFLVVAFWVGRYLLRRRGQIRYERSFSHTIGPSSFTP